jgi:hypothetical protein
VAVRVAPPGGIHAVPNVRVPQRNCVLVSCARSHQPAGRPPSATPSSPIPAPLFTHRPPPHKRLLGVCEHVRVWGARCCAVGCNVGRVAPSHPNASPCADNRVRQVTHPPFPLLPSLRLFSLLHSPHKRSLGARARVCDCECVCACGYRSVQRWASYTIHVMSCAPPPPPPLTHHPACLLPGVPTGPRPAPFSCGPVTAWRVGRCRGACPWSWCCSPSWRSCCVYPGSPPSCPPCCPAQCTRRVRCPHVVYTVAMTQMCGHASCGPRHGMHRWSRVFVCVGGVVVDGLWMAVCCVQRAWV